MRPKPAMWWNYRSPAQKHWTSAAKRGTGTSIGPRILLAALLVVAAAIGIGGIDPQVIDAEWMQDPEDTPLPKMPPPTSDATGKRSGIVAAIPLPPRRAPTTMGFVSVSSSGPALAPELSQLRTSAAVGEPPVDTAAPRALVAIAKADALPPDPAAATATKPGGKPRVAVVRKRVVRVEHRQRFYSGAYAQYGGDWSGRRSGWSGF
jgi:hypothetical protein